MAKKTVKRIVACALLLPIIALVIFWQGCLIKNGILTIVHKNKVREIEQTAEFKELYAPQIDWFRVISHTETETGEVIEIYYTQGERYEKTAWIATLSSSGDNKWHCESQIEWSNSGSADNFPAIYWHHYLWNMLL